jgi:hypothetical protein
LEALVISLVIIAVLAVLLVVRAALVRILEQYERGGCSSAFGVSLERRRRASADH